MSYATQLDMIAAFGELEIIQLTDRAAPPVGSIDAGVLQHALEAADGEINSYLAARYALPLAAVPVILRDCAADIARYRLHDRGTPERVEKAYQGRVAWLRDLAAGRATLAEASELLAPASAGLAEMTSGGRIFGRDSFT